MKLSYCSNSSCNEEQICSFRTKIPICLANESNIHYYEANYHNLDESELANKFKHRYRLTDNLKELVEIIIFEHGISEPKKVKIEL